VLWEAVSLPHLKKESLGWVLINTAREFLALQIEPQTFLETSQWVSISVALRAHT